MEDRVERQVARPEVMEWSAQDELELDLSAGTLRAGFFRMSRFRKKRLPDAVRAWRLLHYVLPLSETWLVAGPARVLSPMAGHSIVSMKHSETLTRRHGEPWLAGFFRRRFVADLPAGELTRGNEAILIAVEPEADPERLLVAAELPDELSGVAPPRIVITGDGNEVQVDMPRERLAGLLHEAGLEATRRP